MLDDGITAPAQVDYYDIAGDSEAIDHLDYHS